MLRWWPSPPCPHPGTEQRGPGCDGDAVIPNWGHGAVTGSQHGRMLAVCVPAACWALGTAPGSCSPPGAPARSWGKVMGASCARGTSPAVPSLNFSHLPLPSVDVFRGFSSMVWSLPTRTGFCHHQLAGMS